MSNSSSLQIVLPCYNPQKDWAGRVIQSMEKISILLDGETPGLIIVNDGSVRGFDAESEALLKKNISDLRVISYSENKGKGFALRTGVKEATAAFIIYTDVDFPYEEESLVSLCKLLRSGNADIGAGVRDSSYYVNVPPGRKRISKILRWMLKFFLHLKITDTQCGLKGFNQKGKEIFLKTGINRFLFDLEFIFIASGEPEIRLMPCEVVLKKGIVFSKVNPRILLSESFNFFKVFLKGIVRAIFGRKAKK